MPKVSVIIPVYNVEKYLRQCLDSVVNQTLEDIEIICINDCSTDNSLSILEEYAAKDSRIKVIINEKNLHAGISRNKGLAAANSEYVYFMDADDYLEPNALELNIKELDSHQDSDYCIFHMIFHNQTTDEKELKKSFFLDTDYTNNAAEIDVKKYIKKVLYFTVVPWNKVYRKKFLTENNILFDNLKVSNDRYFYFQTAFKPKKIVLLQEYLINYRTNVNNSLITKRAKNFDCSYKSYENQKKLIAGEPNDIKNIIIHLTINDIFYFYNKFTNSEKNRIKPGLKKFLKTIEFPEPFKTYRNYSWYEQYCQMTNKYLLKRILRTIFSLKNKDNHKIITILGIKIKVKRKSEGK